MQMVNLLHGSLQANRSKHCMSCSHYSREPPYFHVLLIGTDEEKVCLTAVTFPLFRKVITHLRAAFLSKTPPNLVSSAQKSSGPSPSSPPASLPAASRGMEPLRIDLVVIFLS
jgi:hypothetical protein